MSLEVRPARPDELPAVGALTGQVYLDEGFVLFPDGTTDEHYLGQLRDAQQRSRDAEVVVAVEGEHLLGTLTWCPPGSPLCEIATAADEGEIRMLVVDPAARGRGAARALVRWCQDRARAEGLAAIVLCSLTQMTAAHALYGSLGFARLPDRDWQPVPGITLLAFRQRIGHAA